MTREQALGVDQTFLLLDHHMISLKDLQYVWREDNEASQRSEYKPGFMMTFKYRNDGEKWEVIFSDRATWERVWEALQMYTAENALTLGPFTG